MASSPERTSPFVAHWRATARSYKLLQMNVVKVNDHDKTKYMELLLIADEQITMIKKYLYRGDMFARRQIGRVSCRERV